MADPHLIHTIASAIECGVPKHVTAPRSDGFDDYDEPAEIEPASAREIARELLADLEAAGFRIVRKEMAAC